MKNIEEIIVLLWYDGGSWVAEMLVFGASEMVEPPGRSLVSKSHPKPVQVHDQVNATKSVSWSKFTHCHPNSMSFWY